MENVFGLAGGLSLGVIIGWNVTEKNWPMVLLGAIGLISLIGTQLTLGA